MRGVGRDGAWAAALAGVLLAGGYVLQTLGLERTSVSNAGFVTGMYVVLTPLLGLALFRLPVGRRVWLGVVFATTGLALIAGVPGGSSVGDLLVLGGAAVYSLQILLMERFAPRYDPLGFTLLMMVAAFAVLAGGRAADARGAARLDGVGRAARDRRVRERARVPRADVGAAADEREPHRARLHARAGVGGAVRLHARGRPARRARLGRAAP